MENVKHFNNFVNTLQEAGCWILNLFQLISCFVQPETVPHFITNLHYIPHRIYRISNCKI